MDSSGMKFFIALLAVAIVGAEPPTGECQRDDQCESLYALGSKCQKDGICSNPYMAGCIYNNDTEKFEKRTCNSKDESNADCIQSILNYHEVRVHNLDWESAALNAWIIQIFLSEFLQVPTLIGMGFDSAEASFYAPEMEMTFSNQSYAWDQLTVASRMGGRCENTEQACTHVIPEVWNNQEAKWRQALAKGEIDQVTSNGELGKISLMITLHTAETHPDTVWYRGMTGKREELASIFKRPTSWGDYCKFVSPTNCAEDDGVAARLPHTTDEVDEASMYFSDGVYTGHFRATEKNKCTLNPQTCSGHAVQLFWNNISLESDRPLVNDGYEYDQIIQIWRAANATKSHVMSWWWTPTALVEEFRGTDYQFQPVILPDPTVECRAARTTVDEKCSPDINVRRGNIVGSCDDDPHALQTVVASSLRKLAEDASEVMRSPAYQAILNLKISQLDMNVILKRWVAGGRSGYAGRKAACEWVIEHQDDLRSFIPLGYPKTSSADDSYDKPLLSAAMGIAAVSVVYSLLTLAIVYRYRAVKVFVYAQIPFVAMVLVGMLLVGVGSIFVALEPQDGICVSQKWFVTLGYTLSLVPLLVKIAAINRMVNAAKRMKRISIDIRSLFWTVAGVVFLVIIYLIVWTWKDPPKRVENLYLNVDDATEVWTTVRCASHEFSLWDLIVLCWNGILILCATVLAYQSRNVKEEFNDSKSLGLMIYSHFLFAALRVVCLALSTSLVSGNGQGDQPPVIDPSSLAAATSLLLSFDVIIAVTVYLVPKVLVAQRAPQSRWSTSWESGSIGLSSDVPARSKHTNDGADKPTNVHSSGLGNALDPSDRTGDEVSRDFGPTFRGMARRDSPHVRFGMDGKAHSSSDDDRDGVVPTKDESTSVSDEVYRDCSRRTGSAAGHSTSIADDVIQEEVNESEPPSVISPER